MKHTLLITVICSFTLSAFAQNFAEANKVQPPGEYENIHVHKLFTDKHSTSSIIWVKNGVKPHKHVTHTEHVYVMEGEGEMKVGDETKNLKPGDVVFIPEGAVHSVTITKGPMKVISVQAPEFFGKDRVFVSEE